MALDCPRCHVVSPDAAKFCRNCGLALIRGVGGVQGAGRVPHPEPLASDEPAWPVERATNLFFRWQAAGGGKLLLGTEPLELDVFNGGYALADVVLRIRGADQADNELFVVEREIQCWSRGQRLQLEIPSWELPAPVRTLSVALVSAEFGSLD